MYITKINNLPVPPIFVTDEQAIYTMLHVMQAKSITWKYNGTRQLEHTLESE
jgi:hypothetical protein